MSTEVTEVAVAETGNPVSVDTGGDWRVSYADGDERLQQHLTRFKDPATAWKSVRHENASLKSQIGKAVLAARPTPPETPQGYLDALPENRLASAKQHMPQLAVALEIAHAAGAPPGVVGRLLEAVEARAAELREQVADLRKQTQAAVREAWGDEAKGTLAAIKTMVGVYGSPDLVTDLDNSDLAVSVPFLNFMASIARELVPDGNVIGTPTSGMDQGQLLADELEELEGAMRDKDGAYWVGERANGMQARYRELLMQQERQNARR